MREAWWYLFSFFAAVIIALRVRGTFRSDWRRPEDVTFAAMVFGFAGGVLSKLPPLAALIDLWLGTNAAWLQADIVFISATCCGTLWIDMMRQPSLPKVGWPRLVRRWRFLILILVAGWMVTAASLEAPLWVTLERGTVETRGSLVVLSGRMVYFIFNAWALAYLAWHLHAHRQTAVSRDIYIRLTIPAVGLALGAAAPVIQLMGLWYGFFWPQYLVVVWPRFWWIFTAVQTSVYILILVTLFRPAYRAVIWLDKQRLAWQLRRLCRKINQVQPNLVSLPEREKVLLTSQELDEELMWLVTQVEALKWRLGQVDEDMVTVPAGAVMTEDLEEILCEEREAMKKLLINNQPANFMNMIGSPYALAWWYVKAVSL